MLTQSISKDTFITTYQTVYPKVSVAMESVATTRFESDLTSGQTVSRIRTSILGNIQSVVDRTDLTITTPTDTKEQLTIDEHKAVTFSLTKKEIIQMGALNASQELGKQAAMDLMAYVDGKVFGEVENAATKVATVGGAVKAVANAVTSTPITMTTSNINKVFSRGRAGIRKNNVALTNECMVIDPDNAAIIEEYLAGKDNDAATGVFANGYRGMVFGASMYVSNNLTNQIDLTAGGTIVADDTFTVGSVVFTFKAAPSVAGEVDLGGDDETSLDNLTAAVNGAAGAGTAYIALSAANRTEITETLRVTASNTATVLTLKAGSGALSYSESLTGVTETNNFMHVYFGQKGSVDLVIQSDIDLKVVDEPRQLTTNFITDVLFGKKLFTDGTVKYVSAHLSI